MQLVSKKVSLDKCPHVSSDAKSALDSASQPPIRLITIGKGDGKLEVGNETVMFRHEEKFYHPTGLGFLLEDTIPSGEIKKAADEIKKLNFERVGQKIGVDLVIVKSSSKDAAKFGEVVRAVKGAVGLPICLVADDAGILKQGLEAVKDDNPLIGKATLENYKEIALLAKPSNLPVIAGAPTLNELEELVKKLTESGVENIVLETAGKGLAGKLWDLTQIRRLALKKSFHF